MDDVVTPALDVDQLRAKFPSLAETDGDMRRIYLDNPAGTQVPLSVAEKMTDCLLYASANIGGYFKTSELATAIAEEARHTLADFFNAPSPDEIIFGQNMTTITFHLARSLGRHFEAGDEIVLSRMDHDANVQPWLLMARDHELVVRWLSFDTETYEFDLDDLDELLGDRTRLVCVGGASNLTGTINDVREICRRARAAGAWTYIDAVQSAPHVPSNVREIGCDFLVCSAYKFFGPHQGVLWGRREVLEQLEPYRVRPAPAELPWSFETGTQSHEGMAGTAAAIDYFAAIGAEIPAAADEDATLPERTRAVYRALDTSFAHERELAVQLVSGLQAIPGTTVRGITDPAAFDRRVATVSFTHERHHPDTIAAELARRNIFVWSGHNYAVEVAMALGILDSGGTVRIGAVHYNTRAEIDAVLNALEDILA